MRSAFTVKSIEEKQNSPPSRGKVARGQNANLGWPLFLQPKLAISQPGDPSEQEADRVAEQVMRMPGPAVHRQCAACDAGGLSCEKCAEKKNHTIQRRVEDQGPTDAQAVPDGFIRGLGPGQPLDHTTRAFLEPRLGCDLSGVRLHTGQAADESASALNARAYTLGHDIVFGRGEYQPETGSGMRLLSHELAHTIQQGQGGPFRLQRQIAVGVPAGVPHFRDCVRSVTGIDNADEILNRVLNLAIQMVDGAIGVLANAPVADTVYDDALETHFGRRFGDRRRERVRRVFGRIRNNLVASDVICNRTACDGEQAFWLPADDLLHICPSFWIVPDDTCRAIILIHEAAHDSGVDVDDPGTPGEEPHSPNRGETSYPVAGGRRTARLSRTVRMNTPDAYAFFAAHIHNNADTPGNCFNAPAPP